MELYQPAPFFSVGGIEYVLNWIDGYADIEYKEEFVKALRWVIRILNEEEPKEADNFDREKSLRAYRYARQERETAKENKEITRAVMFLYMMIAVEDYGRQQMRIKAPTIYS